MSQPHCQCVDDGVDPILTELREPVRIFRVGPTDNRGPHCKRFIHEVFRRTHGAEVESFYPQLLGFATGPRLRAVVGYRGAGAGALFSEHYLDVPAEVAVSTKLGRTISRNALVEVGNLALANPGQARWIIASTTAFLAASGYRWVLFTATRPLANAFRRLGLRPIPLATADPNRLPDGGASWGRYYDAGPLVYAGDVLAGYAKLHQASSTRQPRLQHLLGAARRLGGAPARPAETPQVATR